MSKAYMIIAKKCKIDDEKTLKKAKELLLLLEAQSSSCSESCKVAVCLELACNLTLSSQLSRENAIKYSGCKKSVYINQFNLISKILNLDKVYTIKELCLTFGISEIQGAASKLLEKYITVNNLKEEELRHPMYPCAAVLTVSKSNKVRINVSKLIELSRIKKNEMEALAAKLEKLSEVVIQPKKRKLGGNLESPQSEDPGPRAEKEPKRKSEAEKEAEYLEWKKRMLAE